MNETHSGLWAAAVSAPAAADWTPYTCKHQSLQTWEGRRSACRLNAACTCNTAEFSAQSLHLSSTEDTNLTDVKFKNLPFNVFHFLFLKLDVWPSCLMLNRNKLQLVGIYYS